MVGEVNSKDTPNIISQQSSIPQGCPQIRGEKRIGEKRSGRVEETGPWRRNLERYKILDFVPLKF